MAPKRNRDPSKGGDQNSKDEAEIKRGITSMKKVVRKRSEGKILKVGWNDKGQPINPNKALFVGYVGYLARTMVPITISDWRTVSDVIKNNIWEDITKSFDIGENRKRFTLMEVGRLARVFRSYLSRVWIYDDEDNINENPPAQYEIDQDAWSEFVRTRTSDKFKKVSQENSERAKDPEHPYRKSRLGLAVLEDEEMKKAIENGSDVTSVTRSKIWILAHTNSKGELVDEKVKAVAEKMSTLSQNIAIEGKKDRGRNDVLSQVLQKPEHSGRVRGVGFGVNQKEYFQDEQDYKSQAEVEDLKMKLMSLEQQFVIMKQQLEGIGSRPHGDEAISLKDSCGGSCKKLPEGKASCQLALGSPSYRVVAKGHMFNTASDRVLHNRPLSENHVKVSITEAAKGEEDAPLPIALEDIDMHTVGDAIGTFVAWPKTLVIVADSSSPTQSQGTMKRPTGLSRGSAIEAKRLLSSNFESDRYNNLLLDPLPTELYFLGKYMKKMSDREQIQVDFEKEIMNMPKPITEYIGREEIRQLLCQEQLGASHISVYIKFLWVHYVVHRGKSRYFSFLNPHSIAALAGNDAKKHVQQKQYIVDALMERSEKDMLFLAPYNAGEHWLLIVIKPYTETIYYLDSLHSDPEMRLHMQELFDQALLMFRANKSNQTTKGKASTTKWIKVKCPRQMNNVDCGYYVMRFIKEIVSHTDSSIPEKYFPDCRCLQYSQDQIDEVRSEWSQYVHKCA